MVSRAEGNIDDLLTGRNASTEDPQSEGTQSTEITGIDTVLNNHVQESMFTKEAYKKHIKEYRNSKANLKKRPGRVGPFMTGTAEQIKHILANFKKLPVLYGRKHESRWHGCSAELP
ncbi:Translationally-controlled tumor protein [Manis javanica]|nr:Translationally-controlled tumor protein [Manis javanica]